MIPRRVPIGVLAVMPVVVGMGVWAFTGQAQLADPSAEATATAQARASLTAEPTATPEWWVDSPPQWTPAPTETPWPTPSLATQRGQFQDGAWVRVNAGAGDCLNARNRPSLEQDWTIINVCLPDGHEGLITGGATEADGHWWWHLAGLGWVAEEYLIYLRAFDSRANTLPELAGKGNVAFLRGNDIWLMEADGSGQRVLADLPDSDFESGDIRPAPRELAWSPDGSMLSYHLERTRDPEYVADLHILSVADGTERVFERTLGGAWSPDSTHMGIVRDYKTIGMSIAPYEGVPAILEVASGGQLVLGSEPIQQHEPPSFNFDGSLFMVSVADWDDATGTSTVAMIIYDSEGIETLRIGFGDDEFYASPAWSPAENLIAAHTTGGGGARYSVFDATTGAVVARAEPPVYSPKIGGRCGGGDIWKTAWSADGGHVLYSFDLGDTGANGIWAWEVGSGAQRVVIAANAFAPVAGPEGRFMFTAWGNGDGSYIFAGTVAGGYPRIVTDGASPVWNYER